jgi:heterodisulfide reductase subunit A-like polyferredoxin/coenzyme F420-reducing hydrogenase delta subunit
MKTGIYFSRCGDVFDGLIDLDTLADSYRNESAVRVFDDFFDPDDFAALLEDVAVNDIEAVVLVGDSHFSYLQTRNGEYLIKSLVERGINPNRIEIVNFKNMLALPHKGQGGMLLDQKARLLLQTGLEKLKCSHGVVTVEVSPRKAVAIVGVTSAAFVAAQHFLEEGYKVFIINDRKEISLPPEELPQIRPTVVYVTRHPRLTLFNDATVIDFDGYPGDFNLVVSCQEVEHDLQIGAAVLSLQNNSAQMKIMQNIFHVDINRDGSVAALDEVTARSQTQDRGVYVINPPQVENPGLADAFMAADATSSLVINLLNKSEIYHPVTVSEVKVDLCSGCGACVKTCMFKAVSIYGTPRVSHIDPRRCRGCGNCVTACPTDARDLVATPNSYLFGSIDIFSQLQAKTKILLIACEGCGYRCLDSGANLGQSWPIGVVPMKVVCGGQIDTRFILHAFAKGFDGVGLVICGEGCCHNIIGNVDLERRANLLREILESKGIGENRMRVIATCARNGKECIESVNEFHQELNLDEQAESTVLLR